MNPDRPLPPPPYEGTTPRDRYCNFNDERGACAKPAIAHYLWLDGSTSNACFWHATVVERSYSYADRHRQGPGCLLPGAVWVASVEEPPGRCAPRQVEAEVGATEVRELVGTVQA